MAKASHNMAADLSYTYIGSDQYRFRLTVYRDCFGVSASGSWTLWINSPTCGVATSITLNQVAGPAGASGTEVSQLCASATSTCAGGTNPGVQVYYYEGTYTISCQAADWTFYSEECCRNPATNLSGADSYDLYVQATLNNTGPGGAGANANNSPSFSNLPVPYVCAGQLVNYSNNSVEPDGDVLVYTLIAPLHNAGATVPYNAGYSATSPVSTSGAFGFDNTTGQMTFTPIAGTNQVAVVSMRVDEYRNGVLIGSTMRDIQFIVRTGCTNSSPASGGVTGVTGGTVSAPFDINACSGSTVNFNFPVSDPDGNNISVSAIGLAALPGTPVFTVTNNNTPNPTVSFNWATPVAANGLYTFSIRVQDNGCPVLGVNVYTISIDLTGTVVSIPGPVVCGIPITVTAVGAGPFSWSPMTGITLLQPDGSQVSFNPAASTNYTVTNACGQVTNVPVTVTSGYNMDVLANTTSLCVGSSVQIQAIPDIGGAFTYAWSPSTGLSCTNCASPIATPTANTTYTCVTTYTATGCQRTDDVSLTVTPVPAPTVTTAASSSLICAGTSVNLTSSVTPACNLPYIVSSITHDNTWGAGWTSWAVTGDDVASGAIPMGFSFNFFCNNYTDLYLSSNGLITFGAASTSFSNTTIPDATAPNNYIAFCWEDMNKSANNQIRYKTVGTAPNRTFIINYNSLPDLGGCGIASGYVVLYETTNVIEIHVESINCASRDHTLGIENSTGTAGIAPPGRNSGLWTATAESWRFTPPSAGPYTYAWASAPAGLTASVANTSHSPTALTNYTVTVTDQASGCQTTQQVTVDVRNVSAGPDLSICAGGSIDLAATTTHPTGSLCGSNYAVTSIGYAAPPAAGWTASGVTCDDCGSAAINIGFTFNYHCNPFTQLYISSNGYITFGATSSSISQYATVPNAAAPNNMIAICMDDLNPGSGGTIDYQMTGTAPNRIFYVRYNNVLHYASATIVNGHIALYENGLIEIHVASQNDAGTHILGIEDAAGTLGVSPAGRNYATWTATNEAWRFTPPGATIAWTPNATLVNFTTLTPTATPTATTNYTVTVDYGGGCTVSDVVQVVYGVAPATVTWDGSSSTSWFTAANWTPACVPACGTDVIIPSGPANTPIVNTAGQTAYGSDITVAAGSRLQVGPNGVLHVCGDFNTAQTLLMGTGAASTNYGTIHFVGAANQNFTMANAATVNMPNVVVNNGSTVTLNNNMNIAAAQTLSFGASGGRIVTGGNEVFIRNSAAAAVAGHNANSFVAGNLRRAVVGSRSFDFPVGTIALGYQLANVNFTSAGLGGTTDLRAFFSTYASAPSVSITTCSEPYTCVFPNHGKWTIDPNVVGTYTYTASLWPVSVGTSSCGSPVRYTVMKRPSGAGAWVVEGTAACPLPGALAGISRSGLTTFSEFSPVGHEVVLPVEFLNITATSASDFIQVDWAVASESNTNFYQVERSVDQQNFTTIGNVMATGAMVYGQPDHDVVPGTRYYYRVRGVDADGMQTVSNTVEAILAPDGAVLYNVFPNPTSAGLNITYNSSISGPLGIELFDAVGRLVYTQNTEMEAGSQTLVVPAQALSAGVYNLRLTSPAGTEVVRVVRN